MRDLHLSCFSARGALQDVAILQRGTASVGVVSTVGEQALALFGHGKPDEALAWIDRAFYDAQCQSHFHEFWEHRYDIRSALGERNAIEDLGKAISLAPLGPIKNRLEAALASRAADEGDRRWSAIGQNSANERHTAGYKC